MSTNHPLLPWGGQELFYNVGYDSQDVREFLPEMAGKFAPR